MLMISMNKEYIISLIHCFSSGTSFITPPGQMIIFFCLCRFFVVIDGRFDKLDGFFVAWLITTWSLFITKTCFQLWVSFLIQNGSQFFWCFDTWQILMIQILSLSIYSKALINSPSISTTASSSSISPPMCSSSKYPIDISIKSFSLSWIEESLSSSFEGSSSLFT